MSRILSVSLVALSCGVLSGCATVSVKKSEPAASSNSSWTQDLNATYLDAKDSPRFQEWKSCIGLLYPEGSRSVSDLQGLFQEPHDGRQLLQNLKLAWEGDLLLQPSFYDPVILQKFFSGSAVTWRQPWNPLSADVGYVVGQLNSQVIQGIQVVQGADVRVESRCWRTDSKSTSGKVESAVTVLGVVTISGGPFPDIPLKRIRDVFVTETESRIHPGGVEYENAHGSISKGSVLYTDGGQEKKEDGIGLGVKFNFTNESDPQPYMELSENDIPRAIEIREERHRSMEK